LQQGQHASKVAISRKITLEAQSCRADTEFQTWFDSQNCPGHEFRNGSLDKSRKSRSKISFKCSNSSFEKAQCV
jgi:hypothetical protein